MLRGSIFPFGTDHRGAGAKKRQAAELSELLASIVESTDDAIISKNLEGIILSWNKGAESIFGYTADEVIGQPVTVLIPQERLGEESNILEQIRRGERVDHYETVRRRKDGNQIDISLTVSPIRNLEGKIIGASKIARDISERKRAHEEYEQRINILGREAEHRAKNVFATVQAIVHLTQADQPDTLKRAIQGRIQALANVHALFAESQWVGANLGSIVNQELAPYLQEDSTRVRSSGPSVLLAPDRAQTMTVALHELATNAAKYGALSTPGGRVDVEWSLTDEALALRWMETGGPSVMPPKRQGFGTRVLQSMLGQINGDMHCDWQQAGLVCEIRLPLVMTTTN